MADSALEPAERAFLVALNDLGVRYMLVGVTAASVQGARVATEDIDLWLEDIADRRIDEAAQRAGGIWVAGHFGMQPPALGGNLGDRFAVVSTMTGLRDFETEYDASLTIEIDGIALRVLPLERIIESKRAANRPKDRAALPALEAAFKAKIDGVLAPDEIARARQKIRLSQRRAGKLLGGGPRAFQKYESGAQAASAPMSNLLRLLANDPSRLEEITPAKPPLRRAARRGRVRDRDRRAG